MAATRLIALHKNRSKTVAACLKSRTDYAQNPDKTNKGELVSSYECSPLTADEEFMLSKRQYELVTGRRQKNDVIAYQIRQSFKPPNKKNPNLFPIGEGFGFFVFFGYNNEGSRGRRKTPIPCHRP